MLATFPQAAAADELDLVIERGRIVDGTGSPWYVADVGIKDGRIARIGKLSGDKATQRIAADGLVVAPGFIDMMGQTVTPIIDDPKAALNLLTQGITTVHAGEGSSAAPATEREARAEGWRSMAEYFHVVELAGLPLNLAQNVGHTQVRKIVMGNADRKPTPEELGKMKGLVREAMEAGATGLSTALIYPPAIYADTDEVGALAAVAGEYGGRYFTHMRNEGDQLLEGIDEALEIGRKGRTPVHIFHLKTAGRDNWPKMEQAVAKIRAARAAGMEVTADIYPYVNSGVYIESLIHPRHFTEGLEALRAKLDDKELRRTIRSEMEANEPGWENWFKHTGRDWTKIIIGASQSKSVRYRTEPGQSIGTAARVLNVDPWDLFFDLVRTGALVMPESMSEANKRRLIREDFISFCTDAGPSSKDALTSHPRAYGSFPRLLARYVRDEKVTTLERAVSQLSALAANEIMARDRGRIAAGLAADVIVFDYEKLTDRADYGRPHELSEGMKHVVVNGQLVLTEGKLTNARPGKVLRGPGFRRDLTAPAMVTGEAVPELAAVDTLMQEFLTEHSIPGAAVAITEGGRLVYARGFGYADVAGLEKVTPESRFRIASISKPVTAAAVFRLIEQGKLTLDTKVFDILRYDPPNKDAKVDPRQANITIRQLLQHSGGWDRDKSFDAMFRAVEFARTLNVPPPAGPNEVIRNMMAQPLDFDPGARQAYSNYGYCLLGRVIEKLAGQPYEAAVRERILDPSGARTMTLGRSMPEQRQPGEVRYYTNLRGPSVFADNLGQRVPYPYGGWHLEAMDSHGAWIASCLDLVRFAASFDANNGRGTLLQRATIDAMFARAPGTAALDDRGQPRDYSYAAGWGRREGPAGPEFSHSGALAGTSTLLVKRPDGRNWTVLFNTRGGPRADFFPKALSPQMGRVIDGIKQWPVHDLFAKFSKHQPLPKASPDVGAGGAVPIYSEWPFSADEAKRRQSETAAALSLPVENSITLSDGTAIKFRLIPTGKYMQGSPPAEDGHEGDERLHEETVPQPFYMMETQLTVAQYRALLQADPADGTDPNIPAGIHYRDTVDKVLPALAKLAPAGWKVILPDHVRLEYAARAGVATMNHGGNNPEDSLPFAWSRENSGGKVQPVAQKTPNAWGLHDVTGNRWHWFWRAGKGYGDESTDDHIVYGGHARWESGGNGVRLANIMISKNPEGARFALIRADAEVPKGHPETKQAGK